MRQKLLTVVFALAAVPSLAGCGASQVGGHVSGDTLTVYSSLPLRGPHQREARSIFNAEKLALKQAGGKAGAFRVVLAGRDDSTAGGSRRPGWDPGKTSNNANKAAEDSRAIAYIGDLDSSASAISIPVTNEAGFVQLSPASTAVGLTKLVPGADEGEPDKYYPSGERTFARIVPSDDVQAAAAAKWAKELGARRVFLVEDKTVEGQGTVKQFDVAADRIDLDVVGQSGMDPRADDYADFAKDVAKKDPDTVYFGGGVESHADKLWRDLSAALPSARLVGTDRLLVPDFYDGLGAVADNTYITSAAQDPSQLPARGRRFVSQYRRQFGEAPDRYAAYGYTAMSLLLDAIRRAGGDGNRRERVIREVFDTTGFASPVGAFSIDENGDTTLQRIGGYRLRGGRPTFVQSLTGSVTR